MKRSAIVACAAIIGIGLVAGITGCSDHDDATILPYNPVGDEGSLSGVAEYFPLDEGYTARYEMRASNGVTQIVERRIGQVTQIGSLPVTEWILTSNGAIDTNFVYADVTALYFLEDRSSSPIKIFELPNADQMQIRFGSLPPDSLATGIEDSLEDGDDVIIGRPVDETTAEEIGSLTLGNGEYYSHAVQVRYTAGGSASSDYYWFVGGVGLVRIAENATAQSFPDGSFVYELVEYGQN